MTLLVKYRVISSSGKSVCSIFLVNTMLPLPSSHVSVAVSVGAYGELPDLKFLGGNSLVVGLNDRDFVQKPIRPTLFGNVSRAVGVENVPVDPVPIPVLAAGELREIAFAESLGHVVPLSFEVTPTAGAREATGTAALKARRHRQSWNK
jgi:hypothetical protein